ncbi:MAG TPA: response regulator transcription factor [Phycisphaerales bacterium]|nr:response regulator transcription factor [Phycisphaerales bacterium]
MTDWGPVRVLIVDDNQLVVDSLSLRLCQEDWIRVVGTLPRADDIAATVEQLGVDVIMLDVDMPGRDPLTVLEELSGSHPATRTIVLSGHVRSELIDRAVAGGAWGYLSKTSPTDVVVSSIRRVHEGEFAFGPDELVHRIV